LQEKKPALNCSQEFSLLSSISTWRSKKKLLRQSVREISKKVGEKIPARNNATGSCPWKRREVIYYKDSRVHASDFAQWLNGIHLGARLVN